MNEFRSRLKKIIKKNDINQKILSRELKISEATISGWMNGTEPSTFSIKELSEYFNVSADYLLGISDAEKPENESSMKELKLSEEAIENIKSLYKDDHRRIFMLNRLLSDKKTLVELLDNMLSLYAPAGWLLDVEKENKKYKFDIPEGKVFLSSKNIQRLSEEMPENIYPNMRQIMANFIKAIPEGLPLATNMYEDMKEGDAE